MILPSSVPPETSAFLGLVAICMVGLLVLYLYLSKKVCFSNVGNFPCCDEPTKTEKCKITRQLGSSYGYDDDEEESSTDSEKEVKERLYQPGLETNGSRRQSSFNKHHQQHSNKKLSSTGATSNHHHNHHNRSNDKKEAKHFVRQSCSTDKLLARNDSVNSEKTDQSSLYQEPVNCRPSYDQRNYNNQRKECDQGKSMETRQNGSELGDLSNQIDLISMAEKGKIGKTGSSDAASCSSETGSQDTEEEALVPFLHEKAKQKASKLMCDPNNNSNGIIKIGNGRMNKRPRISSNKENESYFNEGFEGRLESESGNKSSEDEDVDTMVNGNGIVKCGCLQVSHAYDPPTRKLHLTIIRARSIPTKERSGSNQVYVKVVLTPNRKSKQSTKPKPTGTGCPEFNESFTFNRIDPEEILNYGVRYRLYTWERMKREHLIGECHVSFGTHKPLQQETKIWLNLEPRSNIQKADSRSDVSSIARSDSSGSNNSVENACSPELLIGLSYNGTTGRLQVFVIRGSQFKSPAMSRAPDTYVKLALVSSSGQEIARSKTSVRRGQPNPTFKETFLFQVALFQLPDVTLLISVYNKRSMKRKEMIGWFSLGRNSTGEEEKSHWNDMKETRGEQIARWHVLLDS
ncbi:synaptotagmin-14 [Tetranychus urticae]|uniref:C2 domain-containing protein n=1 Tax=Tetranychus urticae TaxID=32264 RepID=T1K2G2_TETUR|nr:synaptotagmin-14 [Tetranychus urticae]